MKEKDGKSNGHSGFNLEFFKNFSKFLDVLAIHPNLVLSSLKNYFINIKLHSIICFFFLIFEYNLYYLKYIKNLAFKRKFKFLRENSHQQLKLFQSSWLGGGERIQELATKRGLFQIFMVGNSQPCVIVLVDFWL